MPETSGLPNESAERLTTKSADFAKSEDIAPKRDLESRPIERVALCLSITLVSFFLLLHQPVQLRVQSLRDVLGGPLFSATFAVGAIAFLVLIAVLAIRSAQTRPRTHRGGHHGSRLRTEDHGRQRESPTATKNGQGDLASGRRLRRLVVTSWTVTLIGAGLTYWYLVAVESELVHWPQYMLLFGFLLVATRRLGQSVVWTTLAGLLDEAYQFWFLQAHWNIYLDWNDVLLNLVGAALGVCLALCLRPWTLLPWSPRRALLNKTGMVLAALTVSIALAMLLGALGLYRSVSPEALWVLSRSDAPTDFWTYAEWSRKNFHILSPGAGLLVTGVILWGFLGLDGFVSARD